MPSLLTPNSSLQTRAKTTQQDSAAVRNSVLMSAYRGDADRIREHLSRGFNIDYELNDAGWRLVHVAAHNGDVSLMNLLLEHSADVNVKDREEHWTPLMIATMNAKLELVKILCSNGADIKKKDAAGKSAIDLARQYRCQALEEYLQSRLSVDRVL